MFYAALGRLHAATLSLRTDAGQGTVEYVGLMLLIAAVLSGLIAAGFRGDAGIAKTIAEKLKNALEAVKG
jgi:hypothetical protein